MHKAQWTLARSTGCHAAAYFEREATRCDTVKSGAPGEVLSDGVSLEAVQTAARWSAAMWRYEAAFAQVVADPIYGG